MVYLRGSGACPKRYDCRPRAVTKSIPVSTFLDQMALTTMARECTKPQASQGYKDSDEVKALFAAAKQASTANAWKQAHEARKKARLAWEHAKLDEEIYAGEPLEDWVEEGTLASPPFELQELQDAANVAGEGVEDWRAVGEVRSSESLRPRFATSAHDHASLPSWQDLGHSCLAAFAWTIGSDFANQVGDDEIGNDERDRQGSVESPAFFALIADVCVEEAGRRFGWHAECPGLEGLNLREVLFMDDAIVWDTSGPVLGRRLEQLAVVLAEWGLRLNVDKCQLYRSPYCNSQDDVVVGGHTLVADDHLAVMGLKFRVNQTASEML
ncbi:unnamed protein product, partial [Symbiodinium pilosum]